MGCRRIDTRDARGHRSGTGAGARGVGHRRVGARAPGGPRPRARLAGAGGDGSGSRRVVVRRHLRARAHASDRDGGRLRRRRDRTRPQTPRVGPARGPPHPLRVRGAGPRLPGVARAVPRRPRGRLRLVPLAVPGGRRRPRAGGGRHRPRRHRPGAGRGVRGGAGGRERRPRERVLGGARVLDGRPRRRPPPDPDARPDRRRPPVRRGAVGTLPGSRTPGAASTSTSRSACANRPPAPTTPSATSPR